MLRTSETVLADDLLAIREAGASVNVGLVDDLGHPVVLRAFGLRVLDHAPFRIAVLLPESVLSSLGRGPGAPPFAIAVTVSAIVLFRSVQMKGLAADLRLPTVEEVAAAEEANTVLFDVLHRMAGSPREAFELVMPRHLLAATVTVAETFDQTPGPGAGRSLGAPA